MDARWQHARVPLGSQAGRTASLRITWVKWRSFGRVRSSLRCRWSSGLRDPSWLMLPMGANPAPPYVGPHPLV